jgi:hypothetical protein
MSAQGKPSRRRHSRISSRASSLSSLSALELSHSSSDSDDSNHSERARRRARQKKRAKPKSYNAETDARLLAEALRHRTVDPEPLIEVLPALTHEQILVLTSGFGKICYATALGRWESEAYWANFWYQSAQSRRELLIESLMGRPNHEIRLIKAAFSDKRYADSLEKCMKAELKADKFRTAVLLVLDEKRMDDSPYLRGDLVRDDVRRLADSLEGVRAGETQMINIVVTRSDTHMREVLRVFEKTYGKNFAKEMLRKSTNLVVCIFSVLLSSSLLLEVTLRGPSGGHCVELHLFSA